MASNLKIYIIGGPGTGKSTLARGLAAITGLTHHDLDRVAWTTLASEGVSRSDEELARARLSRSCLARVGSLKGCITAGPTA